MKYYIVILLFITTLSVAQDSTVVFSTVDYDSLLAVVKRSGVIDGSNGYDETVYLSDSLELKYRMPRKGMEVISVFDQRRSIFYWAIKKNNSVSVETKDYTKEIGEKKFKEAKDHFREVLKKVLKK